MAEGDTTAYTGTSLSFDNVNYDKAQEIMITAGGAPENMEDEDESMVTLTAKGGNYDKMEKEITYTVGYFGEDPVSGVEVEVTDRTAPGMATVTWDKPDTRAMVEEYKVVSSDAGAEIVVTGTMATASKLSAGQPNFTVSVLYEDGAEFVSATPANANEAIV